MADLKYLIVNDQGVWRISHEGRLYGTYPTEQNAVSNAMEAAFSSAMSGHKAEVLTEGPPGEYRTVCTYGRDSSAGRR